MANLRPPVSCCRALFAELTAITIIRTAVTTCRSFSPLTSFRDSEVGMVTGPSLETPAPPAPPGHAYAILP